MTRKDYQLIAAAINGVYESIAEHPDATRAHNTGAELVTFAVASALAQDNPRFDRTRFITACEGEQQ